MFEKKRDSRFETKQDGNLFVIFPWLEILRVLAARSVPIYSAVVSAGITVGSRPGSICLVYIDEDEATYFQEKVKARLEKIVEQRIGAKSIGFSQGDDAKARKMEIGEILSQVQPQDLIKFGLIPEFVGRVPVIAPLHGLTKDALLRILTEPKDALLKQYKKLFELDGVDLSFTEAALEAVAEQALERKTGARGLRAILEDAMLDIMYELPSSAVPVKEVVVNDETILNAASPLVVYENEAESA